MHELAARVPLAGIELGGTKCVAILAHGPNAVIDQVTLPTLSPDETLPALAALLIDWRARYGVSAVGIASFGPICLDRTAARYGHILATNKAGWSNTNVLGVITAQLQVPTGIDTDVNGAALAEMRWGAGRGLEDFAYVTVGTGIGVGLIVNGRPTRGLGHSEIGHIRVPRLHGDTAPSACQYHSDCVEGLASGSALRMRLDGRAIEEIMPDDPVWEPIVDALAAMCHTLVGTAGPLRIAIGGGMPTKQQHLLSRIATRLEASLAGYMDIPTSGYIVPPKLGDNAGPLGAISLALDALV